MGAELTLKSAAHWERHATAGPGAGWVGRWLREHALSGGLGLAPGKCWGNVCRTELNKLENADYLFL